jgi:hypothetical protein
VELDEVTIEGGGGVSTTAVDLTDHDVGLCLPHRDGDEHEK